MRRRGNLYGERGCWMRLSQKGRISMAENAKKPRKTGCLAAVGVLVAIIVIGALSSSGGKKEPASVEPVAATGPAQYSDEQRRDFQAFYGEIMRVMAVADDAMATYKATLQAVGDRGLSAYDAYSRVSRVRDQNEVAWRDMGKLSPPSSLSKEHRATLKEAANSLQTSLYSRRGAYNNALKFLDEQKPSYVDAVKKDMDMANGLMIEGMAGLVSVKIDLGITD